MQNWRAMVKHGNVSVMLFTSAWSYLSHYSDVWIESILGVCLKTMWLQHLIVSLSLIYLPSLVTFAKLLL